MINKDRKLSDELRKNVILSDSGDFNAKYKVEAIWKIFKTKEFCSNCDPIMVIHPDGQSEVFVSKAKAQKGCKIGYTTLQRCIDTGEPDRLGRCYDYLIYEGDETK